MFKKDKQGCACIYVLAYICIQYFCKDIHIGINIVAYMEKYKVAEKYWCKGKFYCLLFYSFLTFEPCTWLPIQKYIKSFKILEILSC